MPIGNNACRADAGHDYQDLDAHSIRELHSAPPLNSVWLFRLFRSPSMEFGASVATIRHRPGPRLRFEIPAIRVIRIERRGNRGMPRLQPGQDRPQYDERGARPAEE